MNSFQRSIVSAAGLVATAALTAIDTFSNLEIPAWAWGTWVLLSIGWVFYAARLTAKEAQARVDQFNAVIKHIVEKAGKP